MGACTTMKHILKESVSRVHCMNLYYYITNNNVFEKEIYIQTLAVQQKISFSKLLRKGLQGHI